MKLAIAIVTTFLIVLISLAFMELFIDQVCQTGYPGYECEEQ